MIHTSRTVTVGKTESIINEPIVLYRGDREVEVEFAIVGSKFTFTNGGNVIQSTNATHGQLVVDTPTGENMFSEVTECHEGKVIFTITKEMIDELAEVGLYSFQIRLFDESQVSRVTIPPVYQGIEIRHPMAAEDETDLVDIGLVDYSVVRKNDYENVATFLPNGDYNKTNWEEHDVISRDRLNKVEDALYEINKSTEGLYPTFQNQYDEFSAKVDKDVKAYKEEMEDEVEQFERDMTQAFGEFKVDYEDDMYDRMDVVEGELEEVNVQLAQKANKNDLAFVNVKDFGAMGDGKADDTEAIQNAINYVKKNNGGTVIIPPTDKFYKISSTIFIEGLKGSDSSSITIKGDGKFSTKIQVAGDNINSIFEIINNGYNVNISNLTLIGDNVTDGIKASTSLAISSIKDIIIEHVKNGLLINNGTWVSEYENILIRHCDNGIKFTGHCTSIFLKNTYMYNCSDTGYYLRGTYSTGINLCADVCKKPYIFNYADWIITSLGNENSDCDNVFYFENSNVIIDNVRISTCNASDSIIYETVNNNIKIRNISIADNTTVLKLYEFGYGPCELAIENIKTINSAGISKDMAYLENRQRCYYKEGSILYAHSVKSDGRNVRTPLLTGKYDDKFNITWCDNKPYIIDSFDHQWLNAMPKGTIHLCSEFKNKGIVGFVRSDDKGDIIYRNCEYLPIASIIQGDSSGRPTEDLVTGQCYFDKTLNKPIWYDGTKWVDSTGTVV